MVTTIDSRAGIVVPITTASRRIAQRFAQQCPTPEKANQVRQNTLAVCAVNNYLRLLSIPTDIDSGDSWNPLMRQVTDVADLNLPNVGTFSCRPITPESETCHIPPEDWHDRAGYVAVSLDEAAHRATLLGFSTDIPEIEHVPISHFDPIEALLDRVHLLQPSQSPATQSSVAQAASELMGRFGMGQLVNVSVVLNRIGEWVDGINADGWRAAAELISPADLDFAFRTVSDLVSPTLDTPTTVTDISRAKIVDLGTHLGQLVRAALVVHITQTADRRTSIILQVRPTGESAYLAEGIELQVIDENENIYLEASSRAIDNYIQLRFSGHAREQFGVRISLGESVFREQFEI
jgi:hypothetical protein